MSLRQRLDECATLVEQRLEAQFASMQADSTPPRLRAAMRHAVFGGGKRFRPFLVIESAGLFGVPRPVAVETAAALECIHCYSLAHDDLPAMDNDELRRGRPTVWKAFDDWTAILAGDALLTMAFEIVASPAAHGDPAVRSELALRLARAAGHAGMVGGQVMDLAADKLADPAQPSVAHIRRLQAMKTGALIAFAAEAGAILGNAEAEARSALVRYGHDLGIVFQIADDLLDVEGDAETAGKAVAKDAARGKATLISLMGIEETRALLQRFEADAIGALEPFGVAAETLREAVRFASRRRH